MDNLIKKYKYLFSEEELSEVCRIDYGDHVIELETQISEYDSLETAINETYDEWYEIVSNIDHFTVPRKETLDDKLKQLEYGDYTYWEGGSASPPQWCTFHIKSNGIVQVNQHITP